MMGFSRAFVKNGGTGHANLQETDGIMPSPELPQTDVASAREQFLWETLEQLLTDSRDGDGPDWAEVATRFPDDVVELRELWATAMLAEDFGQLQHSAESETHSVQMFGREFDSDNGPQRKPGVVGDYELLEEIGRGGMGVVFKARQKSLGRIVALKMILRGELASTEDLARFRAEAEAAARLDHPHIVPVYEVGEWNGQPFFSMKYVEGETLSQRLTDGPLTTQETIELLLPVADAIRHAHEHRLMHRDLKPSNILIDRDGRPYVTDFGLARRFANVPTAAADLGEGGHQSLTRSGAILGTPAYMAPEQASSRRHEFGAATDIYSLGALLYAMLTGRAPFLAPSPVDVVFMVLEQDPLPPRILNRSVDADLEMVALKCLQKPIDLRYESATNLICDLEAIQKGEPPSVRSSHFSQVLSRAFRETHHAGILENWGLLWMWHSLVLLGICVLTNALQLAGVSSRLPYMGLWIVGLGMWAMIFWGLRHRSGPVTFVERQIAHIWAGGIGASTFLFAVEAALELPVLRLSPVLPLLGGTAFMAKAGILSGRFYVQSMILYISAGLMAALSTWSMRHQVPDLSISFYGLVNAGCFFVPGLKYYRQRRQGS